MTAPPCAGCRCGTPGAPGALLHLRAHALAKPPRARRALHLTLQSASRLCTGFACTSKCGSADVHRLCRRLAARLRPPAQYAGLQTCGERPAAAYERSALCVKGQQRGDALRCARSDRLAEAGASARGSSFWSRTRDAVAHARHASLSLKSRAHAPAGAHRCEPGRSRSVLCSAECRLIPGRGLSGLPWGAGDQAGRGGRSRG